MKSPFRDILGLFQPFKILLAALTYSLGIAIARYVGISLDQILLIAGGLFIVSVTAAASALSSYFAPDYVFPKNAENMQEKNAILRFLFYSSIALLGVCSTIVFFLIFQQRIQPATILLCAAFVLVALSISVPPVRLIDSGYGEIAEAVLIGGLQAIIAFMLQEGNIHRLVSYFCFPIVAAVATRSIPASCRGARPFAASARASATTSKQPKQFAADWTGAFGRPFFIGGAEHGDGRVRRVRRVRRVE